MEITPQMLSRKLPIGMQAFEDIRSNGYLLYDGYHFCVGGAGMFNPFSVLNILKSENNTLG